MRLRSRRPAEPWQGVSAASPVRRTGPHAYPSRPVAVPRSPALLRAGMTTHLKPADAKQALEAVRWAISEETPLELVGHGTKRALGRPFQATHTLDISDLSGLKLYEPEELVLSAQAGTPL